MAEKNPFEVDAKWLNEQYSKGAPPSEEVVIDPPALMFTSVSDTSVDEAIEIIQAHLDSGKSFTNRQMDVCTKVLETQLPQTERDMLTEIAEQNKYPRWVGLLAQWRRCVEYCEQYAILEDVDWRKQIEERYTEVNGAVVISDGSAKG